MKGHEPKVTLNALLTIKHSYSVFRGSGLYTRLPESWVHLPSAYSQVPPKMRCEKEHCAHTPLYSVEVGVLLRYRLCCQWVIGLREKNFY